MEEEYAQAVARVKDEKKALAAAEEAYEDAQAAQALVQEVAQHVQQQAHVRISAIVSKCLAAVFDEPYEFKVNFLQKRGKTEAEIVFVRDGHELRPTENAGLGVCDVAAFALRAAALCLSRPQKRRVLILDEPFKHLSVNFRERVAEMVDMLSNELDIQFIMTTHYEEHHLGKVVKLG